MSHYLFAHSTFFFFFNYELFIVQLVKSLHFRTGTRHLGYYPKFLQESSGKGASGTTYSMNPNFQNIGTAFVTAYYQAFDSCANGDERGAKISQFYHVSTHFCKGFIFVKPILLWAIRMVFM